MKIWIMRHGEAGFNASSDSQRVLTSKGMTQAFVQGECLGKRFLEQQILLDKVLISPYLRAKQTAEQFEKGLQAVGFSQNFAQISEEWEEITPSGSPEMIVNYVDFLREEGAKHIVIVSHLPLVFELVQSFTQHQSAVHFYPAVIAEIEWNGIQGKLINRFAP